MCFRVCSWLAAGRIAALRLALLAEGIAIEHVDLGGGLGIAYRDEMVPSAADYAAAISEPFAGSGVEISIEPGRSIVGPAGVLLTRVEYLKPGVGRNFAIVGAAMNDLLRPALYGAWQAIIPVQPRLDKTPRVYDLVGPVCETGDFLGKDRELALEPGDLLAVRSRRRLRVFDEFQLQFAAASRVGYKTSINLSSVVSTL